MSGYWPNIGLVLILVLLNAAFAGTEMALISLREGQLKQLEREGTARSRRLVRLARDPNRFLATIQIGITLAGFLASATAAVALAEPLVPVLTPTLGGAAEPLAIAGVTLILTFVTLVFGELAPKRLAMQKALPWARLAAGPLDFISTLSKPAVWLLAHATNAVVRLLGGRAEAAADELSSDELREIVTSHRELNPEQREIISGALDLEHRTVREVLVPRGQVFSLRQDLTLDQARTALVSAGHSRAPVTVAGSLDDVVGIVHWSALIEGGSTPVGRVVSELLVFPDVAPVSAALRTFKARRQQLALVVDEHGDADGIVTLEDLLEEVVGEIYDETDKDSLGLLPEPDGSYVLPGTYPLHDLR
ncbi:MAG: hemolysin family protein, partial [Nostocoides sp.]